MTSDFYPMAPIWFVDVGGSALMAILSLCTARYAIRLVRMEPENVLGEYLLWLCTALACFSLSRSVGHIAQRLLLMADMRDAWVSIRPYSGAFNTLTFMIVGGVTLFFQRVHRINMAVLADKRALEKANNEVTRLNRELESLVRERTEELTKSEKRYRRMFEGSMDMMFILDNDTLFMDINEAGVATLGFPSRDELVGKKTLRECFADEHAFDLLMKDLLSESFVKDRECRLRSYGGSEICILLSATARKDRDGTVVSLEGIAKDITARRHIERQLQRADRLSSLGQIATGIAHEINNPLGIMLGYTQLILRNINSDPQLEDDLKIIEKHARNCKMIVEDLLKFARSTVTHKVSIDIHLCIDEIVSLLAHQLSLDNIVVEKRFDENLPCVVADGEKLKQVFMNVLMNARQAIQRNGRITIRTRADTETGMVILEFEDTGCGIPSNYLEKIFDPFFTTKPVGEGTGLGLSVSYGIIQDHNGRIEVESQVGKGTTFTIMIPMDNTQS